MAESTFSVEPMVRSYHVYKNIWTAASVCTCALQKFFAVLIFADQSQSAKIAKFCTTRIFPAIRYAIANRLKWRRVARQQFEIFCTAHTVIIYLILNTRLTGFSYALASKKLPPHMTPAAQAFLNLEEARPVRFAISSNLLWQ